MKNKMDAKEERSAWSAYLQFSSSHKDREHNVQPHLLFINYVKSIWFSFMKKLWEIIAGNGSTPVEIHKEVWQGCSLSLIQLTIYFDSVMTDWLHAIK